ncbi:hypothetical protein [Qipengyuania gaetbuli]|uniref:hypothetical protein n=1 Tax=Qipengyuania gaetbuli TaxID=266952 RepID=UPI001CFC8979|nr:hypothetical protein [Qipengyuania gaetbuli]
MRKVSRASFVLLAVLVIAAIFLEYRGLVIVHDETGMVSSARLTSAKKKQPLSEIPLGYFVGIPALEGGIEVLCSDGSKVRGGYVTPHARTVVTVKGQGTCSTMS